jgi:hypothetical protein
VSAHEGERINANHIMKPATPSEGKSIGTPSELVRFEFTRLTATTVCVAETFNDGHTEAKPLHPVSNDHWLKKTALPPSTYEYRLVVDSQRIADPLAKETVPNPYGGRNSIRTVADSPEAAPLADAEKLPLKNANKQKTQTV